MTGTTDKRPEFLRMIEDSKRKHFKYVIVYQLDRFARKPANIYYQISIFEQKDPKFDSKKTRSRGKLFVLDGNDISNDGKINIDDLKWDYMSGNGDFRSAEVKKLRDEADIIVTNPPFSLFREFLALLKEYTQEKKTLNDRLTVIAAELGKTDDREESLKKLKLLAATYADSTELTAEIVKKLIERIEIKRAEIIDGKEVHKLNIIYRFINTTL